MCWTKIKEWWQGLFNDEPITSGNTFVGLFFAINDYPGTANDLRGCLNDQSILIDKIKSEFTNFEFTSYANWAVTVSNFKSSIRSKLSKLTAGDVLLIHYSGHGTQVYDRDNDEQDGYDEALYLYDGVVVDDDINELLQGAPEGVNVVVLFDSCFSGSATKSVSKDYRQIKFVKTCDAPAKVRTRISKSITDLGWVYISGCGENEYSYDAFINGQYNGAFTFYAVKELTPELTYVGWHAGIRKHLPSTYPQTPQLEGSEELINKGIFKNE